MGLLIYWHVANTPLYHFTMCLTTSSDLIDCILIDISHKSGVWKGPHADRHFLMLSTLPVSIVRICLVISRTTGPICSLVGKYFHALMALLIQKFESICFNFSWKVVILSSLKCYFQILCGGSAKNFRFWLFCIELVANW